jgi:hypothetical protein
MLFLLDISLTNAWIYYKKCNEELYLKEGSQANFFLSIAEQFVSSNMKWNLYDGRDYCFVDD